MKNYKSDGPCLVCGVFIENGICHHHIKSRGAGGSDDAFNLMPLCAHHHALIHKKGMEFMAEENLAVKLFLSMNGWYFCELSKKWRHK